MTKNKGKIEKLVSSGNLGKASKLLEQECLKNPQDTESRLRLAFIYGEIGLFDKAEVSFNSLLKLKLGVSRSVKAHNALGFLLVQRKDYSNAIPLYQNSLSLNSDQASIYFNLAGCFKEERRVDEAIEAYLESLKRNPDQPLAYREIAQLYEQTHQLEKSREYAELALKFSANDIESAFLISKLNAREKSYALARQGLEDLLDRNLPSRHRSIVLLELGMVLDKLGKYDEAFKLISDANKRLEVLYKPHSEESGLEEYRIELEAYIDAYKENPIECWRDESVIDESYKIIFLIGFPRSGTTLTEQILESHDDIVATHELPALPRLIRKIESIIGREFTYPDDMPGLSKKEINLLRKSYLVDMESFLNKKIDKSKYLLDKLPLNIVHIGFIARVFPEAKILLALRDPRDVCLSCFMQNFTVNQAMRQYLDIYDTAKFYDVVMSTYLKTKDVLSIEVLETRYEDIVENLEASARRLLDFVGVNWDDKVLAFHESAKQRQVHTPSYQGVIQPIYKGSISKWKNYESGLYPALSVIDDCLDKFKY